MLFTISSTSWDVDQSILAPAEKESFRGLEELLGTTRDPVSKDSRSSVSRLQLQSGYYVKEFYGRRSRLKSLLSIDRYSREVRNLAYFKDLGLSTPDVAAVGHEKFLGMLVRGALVTREVEGSTDLYQFVTSGEFYAYGSACARDILAQLARATRQMHDHRFYHGDLKPRNVLVRVRNGHPELFFFDCPSGRHIPRPLFPRYRIKELAHIERDLRKRVRRSDMMYLYKQYLGCDRLSASEKAMAREVLEYYSNRRLNSERRSRLKEQQAPSPSGDS